ncbi:hypothetical protein JRO89_XS07G0068600 [Xanthoceras sorbifolium]|uniref:EF-hand domain-containing protein n=1 Tax=Xanthoceras sorbifolium TaxID=99658 RepID=A0ABQ8HSZ9_9ROSI|nr:hypothetical protein JRO89_XS07G0068600 [Xanthoceras sorbifolium]
MVHMTQHVVDKKGVDKRCVKGMPYTMEQLRQMFWSHDANRDGRLSRKELKDAFNDLGLEGSASYLMQEEEVK